MAELYDIMKPENKYWDRKNFPGPSGLEEYNAALDVSTTVYIGNLSFYTQQGSIKELFSRAGNVKDIIMGIDNDGNPCGFSFVVYQTKKQAELAVEYISKTRLGGRIIRVDMDPGFKEGRQKGRGISGQQRRDDFRAREDPERPRKKVNAGYENSGRGDYQRDRGNSHQRGGDNYRDRGDRGQKYRERGEGGFRGRDDGYRGDRQRGGDRRGDYRGGRDNRGGYDREDRGGQRRDFRDNREQREPREQRETHEVKQEPKPVQQAEEDY